VNRKWLERKQLRHNLIYFFPGFSWR